MTDSTKLPDAREVLERLRRRDLVARHNEVDRDDIEALEALLEERDEARQKTSEIADSNRVIRDERDALRAELEQVRKERDEWRERADFSLREAFRWKFRAEQSEARVKALEEGLRAVVTECDLHSDTPVQSLAHARALLRPQGPGTPETRGTERKPGEPATCENQGHVWGGSGRCVFCGTPKPATLFEAAARMPSSILVSPTPLEPAPEAPRETAKGEARKARVGDTSKLDDLVHGRITLDQYQDAPEARDSGATIRECHDCGTTTDERSACPGCGKVFCRPCAEEGMDCCGRCGPAPERTFTEAQLRQGCITAFNWGITNGGAWGLLWDKILAALGMPDTAKETDHG